MKVLVTGANGYIGRHVVKALLDRGTEVIACDMVTGEVDSRAFKVEMNLFSGEYENLYDRFGRPDVCLHMAWRNGFVHNADTHMGDLSSHYRFLVALMKQGLKHLAIMGTMHEIGYWEGMIDENTPCKPLSQYGVAKNALRQSMIVHCNANGVLFQWLRAFYILGDDAKNHSIFAKICQAEMEGKEWFPFNSGKTKYDFIEVEELANQIASVVMQDKVIGIINCCSGIPVSLAERVEQFIKDNRFRIKLQYGAFPDRPYDSPVIYGDNSKIQRILNIL